MKILGIDPGSAVTGFALLEAAGERVRLVDAGVLKPGRNGLFARRLADLGEALERIVEDLDPDEAAVEDLFHAINAKSALKLAHARGVVLSVLARADVPVAEYTPLQVKKAVSGYGLADKGSLRALVEKLLGMESGLLALDASDAAAVALCHAQSIPYRSAVLAAERRVRPRLREKASGVAAAKTAADPAGPGTVAEAAARTRRRS